MNLRNTWRLITGAVCAFILLVQVSCGQKGDLYLPDKSQAAVSTHHLTT